MKTKCIILSESDGSTEKVPIKFEKHLNTTTLEFETSNYPPSSYDVIELICRDFGSTEMDLMYAYFSTRRGGVLYLGYWNDGIV